MAVDVGKFPFLNLVSIFLRLCLEYLPILLLAYVQTHSANRIDLLNISCVCVTLSFSHSPPFMNMFGVKVGSLYSKVI